MNTNNVEIPGAQEQYLGVWNEKDNTQNAVDALVDSLELIKFVPNEQKAEAIRQWADKTFLNPKNLGIRQTIIAQIQDRQNEFDDGVVEILQNEYNRAVASGAPATPSRTGDFEPQPLPPPADLGVTPPLRQGGSDFGRVARLTNQIADYIDGTMNEFNSYANLKIKEAEHERSLQEKKDRTEGKERTEERIVGK
ncbi:MAG: hypothetical protein LBS22_00110 [Puniceicoccales bacterium]|jgi:hypothetical protein|nr:hypothetical protein [Puniceicoccales bacterium]